MPRAPCLIYSHEVLAVGFRASPLNVPWAQGWGKGGGSSLSQESSPAMPPPHPLPHTTLDSAVQESSGDFHSPLIGQEGSRLKLELLCLNLDPRPSNSDSHPL